MAGISSFDERLGSWRRAALRMFEGEWTERSGRGGPMAEEDVARVYGECLIRILTKDGISVPDDALSVVRN